MIEKNVYLLKNNIGRVILAYTKEQSAHDAVQEQTELLQKYYPEYKGETFTLKKVPLIET